MSHNLTIILYLCIILSSTLLAFSSQKIGKISGCVEYTCYKFLNFRFFLSGFIAWFFLAFTNIGVDYYNYIYIIKQETWTSYKSIISVEPGFGVLCLIFKEIFGNNSDAVLFCIKSFSLVTIFFCIFYLRKHIVVGYAVLAYMTMIYLPSFYLISIMFSVAIIMIAMTYLYLKRRYFIPIGLTILAAQIHNSAYLFIFILIGLWILNNLKKYSKVNRVVSFFVYIIAIFGANIIFTIASNLPGFHYGGYVNNSFNGSGIFIIVLYVPLILICYKLFQYQINDSDKNAIFLFSLTSFLFNVLSYKFSVIERMEFYIIPLYCIFIPSVLFSDGIIAHEKSKKYKTITMIILLLYLLFRAYLVFITRTNEASGMANYQFFWPFR